MKLSMINRVSDFRERRKRFCLWKRSCSVLSGRSSIKSMRSHTNEGVEGRIFTQFIALIIRNKIYTALQEENEKLEKKQNYMTVPAAIRELEKIEMIRQADGVYRLDHAVTANQKIILKAFGIDANYIKRKAEQISNELNPKVLKVKINGRKS